ncbi:SIR2 family protein [Larkinella sp.]|uniref:SIR2 family protein n=1 Tax=Larkinella sp. TaxID=2034517 RepID=UPI003BAB88AC
MHNLLSSIEINFDIRPLVDAISSQKAVVYVGAGASISAGLPDWKALLVSSLMKAKANLKEFDNDNSNFSKSFNLAEKLLREGDFLMSAELLQQVLGNELGEHIWEIFKKTSQPSQIHKAISRIPFSTAITTNYDKLLEMSYNETHPVYTWRLAENIFRSIKKNTFAIIKTHGDIEDLSSLVLTRTQYRDLMQINKSFNDGLTILLSLKTFLFIGSSLKDFDLLRLMDDAKLTYKSNFGPHYAVLFENEVDESFIKYLKDSYNINVILCRIPENYTGDILTDIVCSFLKTLSGSVSQKLVTNNKIVNINSASFSFNDIIHNLLRETLKLTGAERGIVSFVESRNIPGLEYIFKDDLYQKNEYYKSENYAERISHDTILGFIYSLGGRERKYLYYSDISKNQKISNIDTIPEKYQYNPLSPETKSVLITQVFSDGSPVGVVSIESSMVDAFTLEHLKTIESQSSSFGAIFKELELREKSVKEIDLLSNAVALQGLMDNCFRLKRFKISYLFYEINYRKGELVAQYDPEILSTLNEVEFSYKFDETSLATHILKQQNEKYIDDIIMKDNNETIISPKGIKFFNIEGSIYATPVKVGHYTSFILVAWSRDSQQLVEVTSRISRMAHFITNSPDRDFSNNIAGEKYKAKRFIIEINESIKRLDQNINRKSWVAFLQNENNRFGFIKALLKPLTGSNCELARIRLWVYNEEAEVFTCIYSYSTQSATLKDCKKDNEYVGVTSRADDPYCSFTINRFKDNPYAMHQHRKMFPAEDVNTKRLHKDPDGKWIVGPIVSRRTKEPVLLGFISADNHYPEGDVIKEKILSEKYDAYQRYAIDLINDILREVLSVKPIIKSITGTAPVKDSPEEVSA